MGLGRIALIRRRLDTVDRQRRQHRGRAAERLLVDGQSGPSVLGNLSRQRASLGILRVRRLGRAQANRLGADPLAANDLLLLRHVTGILPWGKRPYTTPLQRQKALHRGVRRGRRAMWSFSASSASAVRSLMNGVFEMASKLNRLSSLPSRPCARPEAVRSRAQSTCAGEVRTERRRPSGTD